MGSLYGHLTRLLKYNLRYILVYMISNMICTLKNLVLLTYVRRDMPFFVDMLIIGMVLAAYSYFTGILDNIQIIISIQNKLLALSIFTFFMSVYMYILWRKGNISSHKRLVRLIIFGKRVTTVLRGTLIVCILMLIVCIIIFRNFTSIPMCLFFLMVLESVTEVDSKWILFDFTKNPHP